MHLIDLVRSAVPRRLVAPLMGAPGARLTRSTLRQNLFHAELHYRSLAALYEQFTPDAIFCMMDLSVEAGALGLPIHYPLDDSPTVTEHPVRSVADLEPFRVLDPLCDARIQMYVEVVRRMRALPCLRGAYVIGPFTLAGLLIGAEALALATVDDPPLVDAALELAEGVIVRYAAALTAAGADMIAVLEPTAVLLSPTSFRRFVAPGVRRVFAACAAIPVLHVCGDTTRLTAAMCETGAQGLSLDAPVDFAALAPQIPPDVVLIGNLDPVRVMLDPDPANVAAATARFLEATAPFPNILISTGCDLPLETPPANIAALIATARGLRT
jgi:uroporphyrinogen decarboxylase